ncbi:hypothetical protein TNCV_1547861 [Trichonephila clavipes]|nr:hypothetical protein TNCV_1547861 [Trichonephila clavipes]
MQTLYEWGREPLKSFNKKAETNVMSVKKGFNIFGRHCNKEMKSIAIRQNHLWRGSDIPAEPLERRTNIQPEMATLGQILFSNSQTVANQFLK